MIGRNQHTGGEAHEEQRVVVNDKRRIDPATGALRDLPAPGSAAADPANPANAGQPITASLDASTELEAARQEAAERTADLQRITAEYANYRKRVDRDREQVVANAKAMVLTEMLTVLDDIDRADAHGDLTGAFKAVAERLTSTLKRVGLSQFGAVGDQFDPARHEAVQFATSPEVAEQTVSIVMRHGYSLGDRLVRAAVVGVTGPEHESEPSDSAAAEPRASATDPGSSGGPGGTGPDGSDAGESAPPAGD